MMDRERAGHIYLTMARIRAFIRSMSLADNGLPSHLSMLQKNPFEMGRRITTLQSGNMSNAALYNRKQSERL